MNSSITLTIDGQAVTVEAGTTIHKAAQAIGIEIPTICYHEHCTSNGLCRMCVVEVEGARVLSPACLAESVAEHPRQVNTICRQPVGIDNPFVGGL